MTAFYGTGLNTLSFLAHVKPCRKSLREVSDLDIGVLSQPGSWRLSPELVHEQLPGTVLYSVCAWAWPDCDDGINVVCLLATRFRRFRSYNQHGFNLHSAARRAVRALLVGHIAVIKRSMYTCLYSAMQPRRSLALQARSLPLLAESRTSCSNTSNS